MATLKSQLARCLRRYDKDNLLVLADMLEERELFVWARKLRSEHRNQLNPQLIKYYVLIDLYRAMREPNELQRAIDGAIAKSVSKPLPLTFNYDRWLNGLFSILDEDGVPQLKHANPRIT